MNIVDRAHLRNAVESQIQALVADVSQSVEAGTQVRELDEFIRGRVLEIGAELHRAAVDEFARLCRRAVADKAPSCPSCGGEMRFKQMRKMTVRTVLDGRPRRVGSPYCFCGGCRVGVLVARQRLALDESGLTPTLRKLAVLAGTIEPFESASTDVLKRFARVEMSSSKIHDLCLEEGARADERMHVEPLGSQRRLREGERLYVEIDGGMLHIDRDWHEAKLAVVFPEGGIADVSNKRRQITERQVVCTLGDRHDLGRKLWPIVEPYLPRDPDGRPIIQGVVYVLGDGADWIQSIVDEVLPGATFTLDWYHVSDYIAAAARAMYPDETVRKRWRSRQRNLLFDGKVDEMLCGVARAMMRYPAGSSTHEALEDLHRYLSNRREQLDYRQARKEGRYIGSGVAESGISYVLQQRMKLAGTRWLWPGARAMCALRCAWRTTGAFDSLFEVTPAMARATALAS